MTPCCNDAVTEPVILIPGAAATAFIGVPGAWFVVEGVRSVRQRLIPGVR